MLHALTVHRRPRHGRVLLLLLTLVLTGLATWTTAAPAAAAPCDAPVVSPVACENTLPGTPESQWQISGAGSANIQGFATDISVDQGGTVGFKIDTNATSYRLDIYRMGFYDGDGARKVATVAPTVLTGQPNCITAAASGLVDCGNWTQNASWQVPADAVSGIYFAHAVRTDGTAGSSHIVFVVRDDDGASDVLFQTSDTTWQAYNTYGGNSLYTGSPAGRAYKVSYNRPFTTRANAPEDWVFNAEYPMVRFLESNGYDVSYTTGLDSDRRGNELTEHETFLSVGHDEYWSGTQRTNVELARAAGVNLAFFSGNEVFWKTRWENSIDGSNTPNRTLVSYKETHANAKIDPAGASTWTGTWRDGRFSPPGDGGRPENALTGTIFTMNCCAIDMQVGAADGDMRFWRNTRVADLTGNQTTTVGTNVIGYEWDEDLDNGSRPPGLIRVSQTAGSGDRILDQGSSYAQGPGTHAMTLYRHASGALVFGAGTIQWPWALDSNHDRGSAPADIAAQQATVNLLADMQTQPTTLRPGLVAATASGDATAPTATITSPAAGATLAVGTPFTITGTAADTGGGRVGGVEVSTDNGTTWRRASGRESWTYTFTPSTNGPLTLRVRASDDSANTQVPGPGVSVTIGAPSTTCPCSIWPGTATPDRTDSDNDPVELGVKFRASSSGFITGLRYYKPATSTGTHVGSLWSSSGNRLANVTFTNESASGWQQASFANPVPITAGTTYVASYFTPARYAVSSSYFTTATTRGPLTALANGTEGGNGLYRYTSSAGAFPTTTYQGENYWVDVVFSDTDTAAPTLTARTPAPGATGVAVGTDVTAELSEAVQQATVAVQLTGPGGAVVPAALTYDAPSRTATLDPSSVLAGSTTYTARVSGAKDTAGNTMDPVTWTFTTEAVDTVRPTVTARTPAPGAAGVPLDAAPTATFSEAVQQASITLELRTAGGALVPATTAYAAGTRTVTISPTAALTGSAAYTVSLSGARDPSGNVMDPVSWTFTTEAPDTTAPTVTGRTPAAGATAVSASTDVTATFSEAVQQASIALELRGPGGAVVPSTTAWNAGTRTVTLTPNGTLAASSTYTVNLSGARDAAGNTMAPASWTFTTLASSYGCPCTIWPSTQTPQRTDTDTSPVELGVKFRAATNGFITGIRYYKPVETSGAHVGSLWSSTGTRLANVTFTNESASGWQQASFATPVPVTAGTTYVASYFTPSRYAATSAYFTTATTRGPLTALANGTDGGNALYRYTSSAGAFPNQTFNSENYWVDVVFSDNDTTRPTVTARTPAVGATDVALGATPTATFDEAVGAGSISFELRAPGGALVPATTTYAGGSRTATLTPTSALAPGTTYTATLSGASDPAGNVMSTVTWTFTTGSPDTTRPTVTTTPAAGATGVLPGADLVGVFNEAVQQSTITFELRTPANVLVAASLDYEAGTRTATLAPAAALSPGVTYTARISGAKDASGNTMDPVTWTFTTSTSTYSCPCTIFPGTATPERTDSDTSSVELGVKFRAAADGFITGIRYYKPAATSGAHVGSLWTAAGTRLAQVTFTNESASGWQQAAFSAPVPVTAGTTYVASYFTPSRYVVSSAYFAAGAITRGPLTALAHGEGGNGVYRYTGSAGAFPSDTYQGENYWVDVVYAENAVDTLAPTVTARVPAPSSTGVPRTARPAATFSEGVAAGSITMQLRNSATSALVSTTTAYDAASRTATLTPALALASSTPYTVTVSGATDAAGNTMAPVTWSFETAAPPPPPIDVGPGGPIAVVTSEADASSSYLVEIVRAEGLNEFTNLENTDLSASTLAPFTAVVLGDVAVTDAQVTALTDWVAAGGNLVLMRPDARLLPLAGLTAQPGTVSEGYLRVASSTEAGAGITAETMQFHGTADRYSLTGGATSVAELFTTASAGTGQPAVSLRAVGSSGGQVATFAFDLPRSVILTRQGNPAWAGQNRDGGDPIVRSNDQFFGGAQTDWVDLSKVHIPQADEQQRLLANLLTTMSRDRLPLPRFWYLPATHKAVVVATGDDHARGGTAGRMSTYTAASPEGCSVAQWQCARFTSYVYPDSPLTDSEAAGFTGAGFEVGLHPQNGCTNYTSLPDLQDTYTSQLSTWAQRYASLPAPVTSRFHCLVWSDWASQPKAELASGIRLDTNYYYYPDTWMADRPGFMSGSGMPQRFTDTDGSMIDVYQATTQMTDESGQSYPFTPDTLLDRALGAEGYYGAFTANLHTDAQTTFEDTQVLASAQERGVPVIAAKQLLTWLDGRNASSFADTSWSGSTLSFSINVGSGANQLSAMLPTSGPGGRTLSSIARGATSVPFTLMTVKGQQYAVFAAASGAHTASYAAGGAATITGARTSEVSADRATLTWRTDQPSTSEVLLGTGGTLRSVARTAGRTGEHEVSLDSLAPGRRYTYRVRSTAPDGTVRTWPAAGRPPASFSTPAVDRSAPRISRVRLAALPDGTAQVTWRTDEPATSTVRFGRAGRLAGKRLDDDLTTSHRVVLTDLDARRVLRVRVSSSDGSGNVAAGGVRRLRTPRSGVAFQTREEFRTGTWTSGLVLGRAGFGSLTMAGRGSATYTSRVVDSGRKVDWLTAVLHGSLPRGTRAVVQVRTGTTDDPDGSGWSSWSSPRVDGDTLKRSGRYLQYRVRLTSSATAVPTLTGIGFTHTGGDDHEGEDEHH